jgi:ribosomal protein L34
VVGGVSSRGSQPVGRPPGEPNAPVSRKLLPGWQSGLLRPATETASQRDVSATRKRNQTANGHRTLAQRRKHNRARDKPQGQSKQRDAGTTCQRARCLKIDGRALEGSNSRAPFHLCSSWTQEKGKREDAYLATMA